MATIANLEAILRLDDQMTGQLQKSAGALSKIGTAVATAGGFLLAQGVMAVTRSMGDAIGVGMDYEAQLANVNSILQVGEQELQGYSDAILNLTTNPAITQGPANLAAGMYDIVSSGFEGADALGVLEVAAMAATAGLTQTDVSARAITGTMNAYGQETYTAAQVADVLFKVVDSGVITFEQLANNLGSTTALAANLGVGIDQLGAAYAQLTLNNVSASEAETQIAALMRAAITPTAALTDAVQAYGYESAEALIKAEGLPGFLKVLTDASGGSSEALVDMLGSADAANAALILGAEGGAAYTAMLEEMTAQLNDGGAMQAALEKQMQSSAFAVAKLKQQLQVLAVIGFGFVAPFISRALTGLTRFVGNGLVPFGRYLQAIIRDGDTWNDWLTHLPQPLQRAAHAFGSIVEAVADVVRAFGERGLSGALKTLFTGGEFRQIITGISAIGDELAGLTATAIRGAVDLVIDIVPMLGAFLWDVGSDLASWAWGKLQALAGTGGGMEGAMRGVGVAAGGSIPAVDVFINLAAKLGQWLWDTGSDLVSWALGHLPGTTAGDGTGGPAFTGASAVDVFLDLAAQLGRWIWSAGTDLTSWAKSTIEETITIDNIKAAITVAADTLDMVWGGFEDAAGWVYSKIEKSVTVDIVANFLIEAGTGTVAPGEDATFEQQAKTLIEGILNPVPVEVSPEFTAGVETGSQDLTTFLLSGDWFAVDTARLQQAWMPAVLAAFSPAALLGAISSRFGVGRFGPAVGETLAAAFAGASGPIIGVVADLGVTIERDLGRLQDGIRNQLNGAGNAMRDGWNSLKSAVSGGIDWLTGPIDGIVSAVTGMVAPIQAAYDTIKPIWDFLFGGGDSGGVPGGMESDTSGTTGGGFSGGSGGAGGIGGLDVGRRRAPLQLPGNIRQEPMVIPAPDFSAFDAAMSAMPRTVARSMADAVTTARAGTQLIGSTVASGVTQMVGTVTGLMGTFASAIAAGMARAQSITASATAAILGAVSGAFNAAVGIVAGAMGQIPGIVAGSLGSAAAIAYSSGLAIGQGLASGMNASLGMVRAAANALAAEATRAAQARLQVASPSRVFERIGEAVGDGLAIGISSREDLVAGAAGALASASLFGPDGAAGGGFGRDGGFKNYGNYYEADRYWAPEQAMMGRGINRGRP